MVPIYRQNWLLCEWDYDDLSLLLTLRFISEGHGTKNRHGCFPRNLAITLDYNSKIED